LAEYEAIDVACGPHCTFVVGKRHDPRKYVRDDVFIEMDEPEYKQILTELKKHLELEDP